MTFRIEPELRAQFVAAALQANQPAAQILREFMRAYVAHSCEFDPISAAESRRRQAAVEFAYASVGLEGFKPSKLAEQTAREFIEGHISLADFIKIKPDAEQNQDR